jgi:large subunit ribosomal protein L24
MAKVRMKKGDTVEVIAGKARTRRGRILRVDRDQGKVVVEGVNMIKRHTRANPAKNVQGGIVEREAPIQMSNVMVVSPESGKRTRLGIKVLEDGRKVRVARVDGAILDR